MLLAEGDTVSAYDPEALKHVKQILGDKISYASSHYQAIENADALIIATEWREFSTLDFERIENSLLSKVIFDGRNSFNLVNMRNHGHQYFSIGRV